MQTHAHRLQTARSAVTYICSRTPEEMASPVPNCPGWTVYNAAVHVGKVGIAWQSMIEASPDDPESRTRGYADADSRGSGHSPATLLEWALGPLTALDADIDRPCYFSMTGGHGTVGLWGRHASTELAIHRLDVEHALNHPHSLQPEEALDALAYTAEFFLPAMANAVGVRPDSVMVNARDGDQLVGSVLVGTSPEKPPSVTLTGDSVDALLALWGRNHGSVEISGSQDVLERWTALPGEAFQFGAWD